MRIAARGQAAELVHAQDRRLDRVVADGAGVVGIDIERQRLRHADRIGELDRAARGEAGGDDVLGEVAGDIGGRAIDLGRVLAAERAAAVRGRAAIGIDDDLAAGQPGVAVGSADLEAAGRVDVVYGLAQQHRRDDVGDDPLHIGVELGLLLALVIAGRVLGRDHDRGRGDRQAAFDSAGSPGSWRRARGTGAAPEWRSAAMRSRILWL